MRTTIFFVDDDPEDIDFFRQGCAFAGTEDILFFESALKVIDLLIHLEEFVLPTLIVTDNNMPAASGLDLIRYLKSEKKICIYKNCYHLF